MGDEHGEPGSRRVDGPTADAGGEWEGANESTSFKTQMSEVSSQKSEVSGSAF